MSLAVFLIMLLIVSTFTGVATEAVKKQLDELKKKYYSNLLAGIIAIVLSIAVDAAYIILTGSILNEKMAVYLIALILLSWLSAMVGYDKVMQAISQITAKTGGE